MSVQGNSQTAHSDQITLAAFSILVALLGTNVVAIRFSNQELDPFWGAGARFVIAASLFWAALVLWRIPLPTGRPLVGAVLYGLVGIAVYFALVYRGLVEVGAGFGAVLLALTPLLTLLLAIGQRQETFRWQALAGAVIAFAGVTVVFREQLTDDIPMLSALAVVLAAVCGAEAAVIVKMYGPVNPVAMNAVAMSVSAPLLLGISALSGETRSIPAQTDTWVSFAYIITVGTVGIFLLVLFVLKRWSASASAYQFVLAPMVAIPLAALLLGEVVRPQFALGAALVLAGVYVGAVSRGTARTGRRWRS